jgi:transposase
VHFEWLGRQRFDQAPLEAIFADYLNEVRHAMERVARLDRAIDEAVESASESTKAVVAALQALRGVAKTTAVTVAVEVGNFSRFDRARQLMAYSGAVPSERSTGGPGKARRGSITKTGNAHLRRILTEAAWHYRHPPRVSRALRARQREQCELVKEISWKAQVRLSSRFRRLLGRGKPSQKAATAVARELLGFMWAIGREVEKPYIEAAPVAA